jgi:hypothetical protein
MSTQEDYYSEYKSYFIDLFLNAKEKGGLDYIYTLLRVSGIEDGGWDPFIEAEESLSDLSEVLRDLSNKGREKTSLRLALLLYCHSIEMSAPYQILYNLLRCCGSKNYVFMPFFELDRKERIIQKYPKNKIDTLEENAKLVGQENLIVHIKSFFDNTIRNAFFHSDYTIEDDFKICESQSAQSIKKDVLFEKITRCFAFYQSFMDTYREARLACRTGERVYPLSNFDIFELLVDDIEGLVGFKVHYPRDDGMYAYYERRKDRVRGLNFLIKETGIQFQCGLLTEIKNVHMMNGKVYHP